MTKFLADDSETRLDRFELIAELASGGMATVYLGRLSGVGGFQRFVAIKRLHPHLANDQEFIQMFLDEARLAARLHHPNVVPILEIGTTEQGYYLVMEYIEGDTLARLLARSIQSGKAVGTAVSIRVVLDTLAGLHAAHELTDDDGSPLHIVHRDVSPQNILLGMDGVARITDFGVARAASRLTTTRSGQLKGKLAYMAPEQARGKEIDRRADVFAMGVVLWETLAQKRLFKGDGEAETLNRILFEPIPSVVSANPDVPKEIDAICMRALEREADKRYASCSDFADALEKAARSINVLASHKDVAAHAQAVMGTDISTQREALRAWLTRSEPSRQAQLKVPSSAPSASRLGESSSVSSAVIALQPTPSSTAAAAAPSPARSRGWIGAVAVAIAVAAGGIAGFMFFRNADSAPNGTSPSQGAHPEKTAEAPPVAPTASAVQQAPSVAASPAVAATDLPQATAAAPPPATKGKKPPAALHTAAPHPTTGPTPTATQAPTPTTTKPTLPDENPYR